MIQINEISSYIARNPAKIVILKKNDPSVLTEVIKPFPDIDFLKQFATSYYWSNSESVNIFDVVGNACQEYQGFSWLSLLSVGKKMSHNLSLLATNPWYYFEQKKKEPEMRYTKVNDEVYVSGEGNHRTAICKVLFYYVGHTVIYGITYDEYKIDYALLNSFCKLNTLLRDKFPYIELKLIRINTRREDAPGWYRNYYEHSLLLVNHKKNKQIELASDEIDLAYNYFLKANFFNRIFVGSKIKIIM
ncbi:MAG: hypothetical protein QXG16_04800 [Candidatus Anstonellaceae archaeon]